MTHDVFISYSSRDKAVADAICARLENLNIPCWIAPRDVAAGQPYAASIVNGIDSSRAMVLVLSERSNQSAHVLREVGEAVERGIPIIPLRIDNVVPTTEMRYYIKSIHWLDAVTPPLEGHLDKLSATVQTVLTAGATTPTTLPPSTPASYTPPTPAAVPPPAPASYPPSPPAAWAASAPAPAPAPAPSSSAAPAGKPLTIGGVPVWAVILVAAVFGIGILAGAGALILRQRGQPPQATATAASVPTQAAVETAAADLSPTPTATGTVAPTVVPSPTPTVPAATRTASPTAVQSHTPTAPAATATATETPPPAQPTPTAAEGTPLAFNVTDQTLWRVDENSYTVIARPVEETFAWSKETVQGDFTLRARVASEQPFGRAHFVVFGDGKGFSKDCLIFSYGTGWVLITRETLYPEGENRLAVKEGEFGFQGAPRDFTIEITGGTANFYVDGAKAVSASLPPEIRRDGVLGLYQYRDEPVGVTYSDIRVETPGGGS